MKNLPPEQVVSRLLDEMKRLRKAKALSQEKLADLTGIHPSMISLLESKKRSPTVIVCLKLCRALGVRLEKLLSHAQE